VVGTGPCLSFHFDLADRRGELSLPERFGELDDVVDRDFGKFAITGRQDDRQIGDDPACFLDLLRTERGAALVSIHAFGAAMLKPSALGACRREGEGGVICAAGCIGEPEPCQQVGAHGVIGKVVGQPGIAKLVDLLERDRRSMYFG